MEARKHGKAFHQQDCINLESYKFKKIKNELDNYIDSIDKQVKKEYAELEKQKKQLFDREAQILDSLPLLANSIKSLFKNRLIELKDLLELKKKLRHIADDIDIYLQLYRRDELRRLGIQKIGKFF
jgi:hypothetical protein